MNSERHGDGKALSDQAKVLNVVEAFLGPQAGLASVKDILRKAGYDDLVVQVPQLHRKRSRAAHPHEEVAKRLENAFINIKLQGLDIFTEFKEDFNKILPQLLPPRLVLRS